MPLDQPDDELTWQELVANAAEGGVTLYDWFVIAEGRWAYSLPQFAPTRPQWSYGRTVDWVRFASLADDWPHAYQAFDCSLLDPADEDERRIGLAAAHPDLHDLLDEDDDDDAAADFEVNPHLHLAAHEIVANQLIGDDPPEARETAERLLDEGFERHEVLHMLGFVVMEETRIALLSGEPIDRAALIEGFKELPDSWRDLEEEPTFLDDDFGPEFRRERERIEAALLDHGPLDSAALLQHLGLDDADPQKLARYLHWHEDFAHVLPDGRVAHEATAFDGIVLVHRVTAAEREAQRLSLDDLHALLTLSNRDETLALERGGTATIAVRHSLEGAPLTALDTGPGVWTLDGPDGWLDEVRDADVVAVEWRDGVLRIRPTAVDDGAAVIAARTLAGAFEARANGSDELSHFDQGAHEGTDLLLDVLVVEPTALRRPTAPLNDLVSLAGLSHRGDYIAPGNYDWDAHDRDRREGFYLRAIQDADVERADEPLAFQLIHRIESWIDGELATPRALADAGEQLLVPGIATAVFNAHGRYGRESEVAALLEVADRIADARSGRADGGARFLEAKCADKIGDGVRADAHIRAALAGGLDDIDLFELAADYMFIGGDLARAAHLHALVQYDDDEYDDDVAALLAPFQVRAERNDPCPCGSGHKYKRCHGHAGGPHRTALERAELVHLKAVTLLERVRGASVIGALGRLGWSYEDRREPTPLQERLAVDLTLFEGGLLERIRDGWGALLPTDEQRIIESWLATPIAVIGDVVTRELVVGDTRWQPWELQLGTADPEELASALAGADHLQSAEALVPLLADALTADDHLRFVREIDDPDLTTT